MTRFLLLCLLLIGPGASAGRADDLEPSAREAVAAGRYRDAIALYEQLSAREPDNADHLVWLGRLRSWVQEYPEAIDLYDRALARAPHHVEALLGKISVLLWSGRFPEAYEGLVHAERLAPGSVYVQLAFARYHLYQREERAASVRVRHALALEPANAEALQLQSQILPARPLEVTIGYGRDAYSFVQPGNLRSVTLGYRTARGRVAFQYEGWDKFGERVSRAGVTVSRQVRDRLWVRGGAMVAPGATVLARREYSAGFSRAWAGGFALTADYRRAELADVDLHIVSPGVEYYVPGRPIWVQAVVSGSFTHFDAPIDTRVASPALMLRYNHQVAAPIVLRAGYAAGRESFAAVSIDQIGSFRANTYSGGMDVRLHPACSVGVDYSYQRRSSGATQQTLGISVSLRG